MSYEAFAHLLNKANLEHADLDEKWFGHRVRAVDGTVLTLPRSEEILEYFPIRHVNGGDPHYPKALIVVAANIMTSQPTHAMVGNKFLSETGCLTKLVTQFSKGDIALLDRGIGGRPVWKSFEDSEQFFIGRIKAKRGKFENKKLKEKDEFIEIALSGKQNMRIRICRGPKLQNGQHLWIVTNLCDQKKYPRKEILALYGKRQGVEDVFLNYKNKLGGNVIRSKKLNGILQEIFASLTMTSIVAGIRYQFERTMKRRRVSLVAIVWRIENSFGILLETIDIDKLSVLTAGLEKFGHVRQVERNYPRLSLQPENKWIRERRRKAERCRNPSKYY